MEEIKYKIKRENSGELLSGVKLAKSFDDRLLGLMFKKQFEQGVDGLIIEPCISIHTFFMRMDIDVIFLSRENSIIKIIYGMKPWRVSSFYFDAQKVLEVKAGSLPMNLKIGEKLEIYV